MYYGDEPRPATYLLVTLLTVVGVGSLEKVALHEGIEGLKQVLLVSDVDVEGRERLLSGIPVEQEKPA